jgi:hypothetical protein
MLGNASPLPLFIFVREVFPSVRDREATYSSLLFLLGRLDLLLLLNDRLAGFRR